MTTTTKKYNRTGSPNKKRYKKPVNLVPILNKVYKQVVKYTDKNGGKMYEVISELIELGLKEKAKNES